MIVWNQYIEVDDLLPDFFNKKELNHIMQITKNSISTKHVDDQDSDYSNGYDSSESSKSFDINKCESYDPSSDTMKANRPENYSHYLRKKDVERNIKTKEAILIVSRKNGLLIA